MAFADPQSINPGSGAVSLPRTGQAVNLGEFTSGDTTLKLSITHEYLVGKDNRTRRTVRVDRSKISADPLVPSTNVVLKDSAYIVYNGPQQGFTSAEAVSLLAGLAAWGTATTNAAFTKLAGGES